jgi:hypothetical protein
MAMSERGRRARRCPKGANDSSRQVLAAPSRQFPRSPALACAGLWNSPSAALCVPVAQSARSPDKPWFTTEPGLPNDAEKLCYAFLVANIDWDVGRLCRPRLQRGGGRDEVACAAAWEVE